MILLTGATGFVGSALASRLLRENRNLNVAIRRNPGSFPSCVRAFEIGSMVTETKWDSALKDIDVVVHAAARVHVMDDSSVDPLSEFRRVNVEGTLALARQAAAAKVRRFVFVSSIKVNGESTSNGNAFHEDDEPALLDPYGISKTEAEQGLRDIAAQTGMEVVIVRPPLVYGPGVKANFLSMMSWLLKGVPLPLGAIHNKRSFVGLDNLVDFIVRCTDHPAAANQTFLASDGEDISTTQLLRRMGGALGKPARLLPVPVWMLEAGAALLGKRDLTQRLCGNLQVDISKAKALLGWSPPVSMDEGLRRTAEHYLEGMSSRRQ